MLKNFVLAIKNKINFSTQRKLLLSTALIALGVLLLFVSFWPILKSELWYYVKEARSQDFVLPSEDLSSKEPTSVFAKFLSASPVVIKPVNKEFSLVIEKIGVNVPIVANVPVTSEAAYNDALKSGIAHASLSKFPSESAGNVYLFAHASINFWQLGKYSTVFNLLRKLTLGDKIHVFYDGKDFVYEVVNKEKYKGWNTYPLTRAVIEPTLTLQTCDPPGTTLNRLVVTANLVDVIE